MDGGQGAPWPQVNDSSGFSYWVSSRIETLSIKLEIKRNSYSWAVRKAKAKCDARGATCKCLMRCTMYTIITLQNSRDDITEQIQRV